VTFKAQKNYFSEKFTLNDDTVKNHLLQNIHQFKIIVTIDGIIKQESNAAIQTLYHE